MPGLYSHTTRATGTILTANIYNTDHQNHINNHVPDQMDDLSSNTAAYQATTDPGESGSESLPTSLEGEIQRVRHILVEAGGNTYWYESPDRSLALNDLTSVLQARVFS